MPRKLRRLVVGGFDEVLHDIEITYFLIFFGRQSRFFFAATAPQSLQR
jgi:hypothetical protein